LCPFVWENGRSRREFEALVVALQGPVYRLGYRWCGNAQDTFVKA
jgi:hypothetical protein